jgi:hypothetical protein
VSAHLRRVIAVRVLIVTTHLAIAGVRVIRTARHPLLHGRRLAVAVIRPVPGRPRDGEPLSDGEMRAFIAICRGWKHDARPEGSRT